MATDTLSPISQEQGSGIGNPQVDILGGIARSGAALGDAVADTLNYKRGEKHQAALQADADAALAATQQQQDALDISNQQTTGDPDADYLLRRLGSLEAGISQATGSRKDALALQLRKTTQEFSQKYPRLRAQLGAQMGRFISTDPEVAALDAFDTARKADLELRQAEVDDIKEYGRDTLGMDPALTFGSTKYALEYARRSRHVQTKVTTDQMLASQEADQNLEIDDYLEVYQAGTVGEGSDLQTAVFNMGEQLDAISIALSDPVAPGASQTIQTWNNGAQQQLLLDTDAMIFEAQRRFQAIPIRYQDNPKFAAAKAFHEEHIGALRSLRTGVETNNPSLIDAYKAYETAQLITFEQEQPVFTNQMRIITKNAEALVLAKNTFDARGEILGNDIGKAMNTGLAALFGRDVGLANPGALNTGASTDEMREQARAIISSNSDIYQTGNVKPRGQQRAIVIDEVLKANDEYINMATTPDLAATNMLARGARYEHVLALGNLPVDGQQALVEQWANPQFVEKARLASQSGQPNAAQFAVEGAAQIAAKYEPARKARYTDLIGMDIGSAQSLASPDLLKLDYTDLDKGIVRITVDPAKVQFETDITADITGKRALVVRQAQANAATLQRIINKDLKWKAHLQAVWNGTYTPDYATEWESSFASILGTAVNVED